MKYVTDQKMGSVGFTQFRVTVMSIDSSNHAQCQDQYGRLLPLISIYNIMGSGALPQVGEDWMISRAGGSYTFLSRIISKPPTVTTLADVITALQSLGFVISGGTSNITAEIPGVIKIWPTTTAPGGYLLCDGSSYPETSYPELAAVLGVSSGNFIVPDFQGLIPVGYLKGDPLFGTLLGTGGEVTHALTTAEGASHTHTLGSHSHGGVTAGNNVDHDHTYSFTTGVESNNHTHGYTFNMRDYDYGAVVKARGDWAWGDTTTTLNNQTITTAGISNDHTHSGSGTTSGENTGHTHGIVADTPSISTTSTATGHNNVQPYRTINFIIKT